MNDNKVGKIIKKGTWSYNPPRPNRNINRKVREIIHEVPKDEADQNDLANEVIKWSLLEESLFLEEFPLSKKISPYRFFQFAKNQKNPYFTNAVEFARAVLSVKMQKGVINKKLDREFILRLLPIYNLEYKEFLMEQRTISQSQNIITQNIIKKEIIEMPDYDTGTVPQCIEHGNSDKTE